MMKVHDFNKSLEEGKKYEEIIDDILNQVNDNLVITQATDGEQQLGIDRIITDIKEGDRYTVEYKADKKSSETGNIFIEIWSNVQAQKRGWAYTSCSQYLYLYLPHLKELCIMNMLRLKNMYRDEWEHKFPKKQAASSLYGTIYNSEGIIVPINEFKSRCEMVLAQGVLKIERRSKDE